MTDENESLPTLLDDCTDLQAWVLNTEASIVYKGKSLKEWVTALRIPATISTNMSIEEVETINNQLLILTETVMSNLSIAKASHYAAKAAHDIEMLKARDKVLDELSNNGSTTKRAPSSETIEKLCYSKCINTWTLQFKTEITYEFWNVQSYKLSHLHSRMTSLNILKNINSKL